MVDGFNLMEIRELYGLSQDAFARQLGYSREVINKVEKGRMKPSRWLLEAVQEYVSSHGRGEISHEVNIFGRPQVTRTPAPDRRVVRQSLAGSEALWVPLVGVKAQAGYIKSYAQVDYLDALEKYSLPPGVNPMGAVWRYFEIDGDSMEPTLSSGDVVLATMVPAEDWCDARDFCVYIVHTDDQLLIKRIYKKSPAEWVLVSDNEELYPQVTLPVEDIRELWLLRRHIRSKAPQPREFRITA